MRIFSFLFACLFIVICVCTSCKDPSCTSQREFNLPLKAYGIKDTLSIGDTLKIRLDIPDKMPERTSGHVYDFINYDFQLITYIVRIDTLPVGVDSQVTFDWVTTQGESKYASGVYLVLPEYFDNTYQYEVLIIPKQKGLYDFGMNSVGDSRSHPLVKLEAPCSREPVFAYMKLENDTNVNFEFLKQSPDPIQANTDRKRFDEYAGFCFYVK